MITMMKMVRMMNYSGFVMISMVLYDDYLQVTTFWRRHGLQCFSLLLWRSSTPRCDDDDYDDSNSDNDSDDHVSFTVPAQFYKIHCWINLSLNRQ